MKCEEGRRRASLEEVITTNELRRRESRLPDYESQADSLSSLVRGISDGRHDVLQSLVDETLRLSRADSAGISILDRDESGREVLRWHAAAGPWSRFRGETMPRDRSPCGVVLERDQTVMMSRPERHFEYEAEDVPPIVETLLVPFRLTGESIGTLWSIFHEDEKRFDTEDERLLNSLASCAGACFQLTRTAEAAEAAARSKAKFLARISHELRNPLHTIQGYLNLLLDGILGSLTAHQHRALHRTRRTASHLIRMIEEILLFARTREGREPLKVDEVDVADIVQDIAEIYRGQAESKGLGLEIAVDRSVTAVSDEDKVRHILANLVGNAVKFTKEGSVWVEVNATEQMLELRVQDSGPGIPPERLDQIFEPFNRGGGSGDEGTGLGLAIVERFAQALGGDATVESRLGEGTTFTVRVPRHLESEGEVRPEGENLSLDGIA